MGTAATGYKRGPNLVIIISLPLDFTVIRLLRKEKLVCYTYVCQVAKKDFYKMEQFKKSPNYGSLIGDVSDLEEITSRHAEFQFERIMVIMDQAWAVREEVNAQSGKVSGAYWRYVRRCGQDNVGQELHDAHAKLQERWGAACSKWWLLEGASWQTRQLVSDVRDVPYEADIVEGVEAAAEVFHRFVEYLKGSIETVSALMDPAVAAEAEFLRLCVDLDEAYVVREKMGAKYARLADACGVVADTFGNGGLEEGLVSAAAQLLSKKLELGNRWTNIEHNAHELERLLAEETDLDKEGLEIVCGMEAAILAFHRQADIFHEAAVQLEASLQPYTPATAA